MTYIQFLGAAETVTGSKHLIDVDGYRVLIDCGLFQGLKQLRLRNWEPLPISPSSINAVILTHAHIDHSGYLPRLGRDGFRGKVYCTPATDELTRILLPDSARLQEEDAEYANKTGSTKHNPALPLYTEGDANAVCKQLEPVNYHSRTQLTKNISFEFAEAGHILGSSLVLVDIKTDKGDIQRLVFTGDLGRYNEPIINDPEPVLETDYLVIESTYGDRVHPHTDPKDQLADIINKAHERGGHIIIPAFAVGRTQLLLYLIRELENENRIPIMPIIADSPMAGKVTNLYLRHKEDHDPEMKELMAEHINPFTTKRFNLANTRDQSKAATNSKIPSIIISAAGMATGGRVLHHLRKHLPDKRNTVVFAGYQAEGTRGRRLVNGEKEIKIFGEFISVNATIEQLDNLSAHADSEEIIHWLGSFKRAPKAVFIVHGEPHSQAALRQKIVDKFGWNVIIPKYLQKEEL